MGYKYQQYCFDTKQQMLDFVAQNCMRQGGTGGLSSYVLTCSSNTDDITVQAYSVTNGAPQTAWTYTPQLITCDTTNSFSDAVSLSWQLALILVSGFAIRAIIQALKQ